MGRSLKYTNRSKKKKSKLFWIFLMIYTIGLLLAAKLFLNYTDKCLNEYEQSQSENAMKDIMNDINSMILDGSIKDEIDMPQGNGLEDANSIEDVCVDSLKQLGKLDYKKDSKSYKAQSPIYDIICEDKIVAKVTLAAKNERVIFGMLTIMDWEIDKIETSFDDKTKDYTVTVPSNYKVKVNGNVLDDKYIVQTFENDNEELKNIKEYVEIPKVVKYELSGFFSEPSIDVYNDADELMQTTKDDDGNVLFEVKNEVKSMPDDRKDKAYEIAKMWEDFVTRDLTGAYYGLNQIQANLVKDSYYYKFAYAYATGPDITMISDHTIDAIGYTDIVVDNYIEYSQNCFSCHISFVKHMLLTKVGNRPQAQTVDSTFYFVNIDDTSEAFGNDDGVNNPHWCMVDMVATTKNN